MYTFPALISSSDWNLKEEIQRCFRISSEIPLMLEQKKKEEIVTIEKAKVGQRSEKKEEEVRKLAKLNETKGRKT